MTEHKIVYLYLNQIIQKKKAFTTQAINAFSEISRFETAKRFWVLRIRRVEVFLRDRRAFFFSFFFSAQYLYNLGGVLCDSMEVNLK